MSVLNTRSGQNKEQKNYGHNKIGEIPESGTDMELDEKNMWVKEGWWWRCRGGEGKEDRSRDGWIASNMT